ncbi:metallophosphoesterase family protein [Kribbella speibonae]|uniref:Metallophosphoesterase n=1 Tax=Kribbella speibonae TaxID=1572660 RepID=A0A4R0J7W9_9ACTN|nr:metallophosphoesterase family protein [Kribbella speibonae]TCC40368.1 metallophosphoesterase [Kribbella speibonae]
MGLDRIALISDVHGNLTALEAVLADIEGRGIERVFNLGDYAGKGPRGQAVVDRCQEVCEVNILGNWDDFLPDPERVEDSEGLRWWRNELREDQWAWLRGLPFCHDFLLSGRQVRLFHASSADVHHRIVFDHDEKQYASFFENTPATGDGPVPSIVGYADIHDPFYEEDRGRTLFNTGSVGNSLGDPTPGYVILEGVLDSPDPAPHSIQFVHVPYDAHAELAIARELGMPELDGYEAEIIRGVYRTTFYAGRNPRYHRPALR